MSDLICTTAATATCGHGQTGSEKVFIEGAGVTRVNIDTAVGLIFDGGSLSVFVEGYPVSLPGDLVQAHTPCWSPGGQPHCVATTQTTQNRVSAGDAAGGGGWAGQPDLHLNHLALAFPHKTNTKTTGGYALCYKYIGDITFTYTIVNTGASPAGPFNVGLWEVSESLIGYPVTLPRGSDGDNGTFPLLLNEFRQEIIPPGGEVTGTIVLPPDGKKRGGIWDGTKSRYDLAIDGWYPNRAFTLFLDLDNEVWESAEMNNTLPVFGAAATYYPAGCN